MSAIQQGTAMSMAIEVSGFSLSDAETIEIVFKADRDKNAPALKTAVWKSDGTGDVTSGTSGGKTYLSVPWTRAETYLFPKRFYFHARVHMEDDSEPQVEIQDLIMGDTLFGAEEDYVEEGDLA